MSRKVLNLFYLKGNEVVQLWRTLQILKLLEEQTNEKEGLTIYQIRELLQKQHNIEFDRVTISRDLKMLEEIGVKIFHFRGIDKKYRYYIEPRLTKQEARVILDALGSNKYLVDSVKQNLIKKILGLLPYSDRSHLKSLVDVQYNMPKNIDMLFNLEKVHEAIELHHKIQFKNGKYTENKRVEPTGEDYLVIPHKIYFQSNRYYLICDKEIKNRDGMCVYERRHIRIDRMIGISLKETYKKQNFIDSEMYKRQAFGMHEMSDLRNIKFSIHRSLLDAVIEEFGEGLRIEKDEARDNFLLIRVEIGINKALCRWILKQGSEIIIHGPQQLREQVATEIQKMMEYYKAPIV